MLNGELISMSGSLPGKIPGSEPLAQILNLLSYLYRYPVLLAIICMWAVTHSRAARMWVASRNHAVIECDSDTNRMYDSTMIGRIICTIGRIISTVM